jgi:hypothetical protein
VCKQCCLQIQRFVRNLRGEQAAVYFVQCTSLPIYIRPLHATTFVDQVPAPVPGLSTGN